MAVGFYEHLPNVPQGRADLARRLSFDTLLDLRDLFFKMNTPEAYEALQDEVAKVHGRRLPEPSRAAS